MRLKHFISVFLALLFLGVGQVWATTGSLVSALNGISDGETYYIAALNSEKYYTVPNTTIDGQTFTCAEGDLSGTTLTPADGAGEFVFTAVSGVDNAYYIYNTNLSKYLVATASKKFGYVDNTSDDYGYWTFSTVSSGGFSGVFSVTHSSKTHYMRAYNNSVRCYDGASNNGVYLFQKEVSTSSVSAPSMTPSGGNFVGTQSVTLEQEDGKDIYYTTNGDDPTTDGTLYSAAFTLTGTTTVKAAAKDGSDWSDVVSKTFTKFEPLTTMDAIFAAATAAGTTETVAAITFNNWVVSGVSTNGKNVFITDGTKGFVAFNSGGSLGFVVGDVLNGTVFCKVQLYKQFAEITNLSSSTDGLTVTSGGSVSLNTNTIDQLAAVNTSALVKIENLEYNGSVLSDGTNTITPYTSLFATALSLLENGKSYNVTGVFQLYDGTKQIHPRSAADIEEVVEAGAPEAPTFSPAEGTYTEAQNVTISCATDGVTIYYTTDGSAPSTNSDVYSSPIAVSADMTIKAIAVKNDVESALATATYMLNIPLTTMDAIFNKATVVGGTATDVTVELNNWVVSGVKGSNAFVTDGTKGFVVYASSHGFAVGDVLSGTVACKVQLYKGSAELTNLTSSTTGLTVTPGGTVTVNTLTIDQLGAINTGAVVKIVNLSYDGTDLSDGTNTIKPYNKLFTYTMESGHEFNVTGVANYYDALQIMPRSAADIEDLTVVPVTGIDLAESTEEVEVGSTVTLHASVAPSGATNKTIVWSVQSGSDYASVADGVVTGIAAGEAVIRAASDEDATIYDECTVTVTAVDPTKHKVTFDATVDKTTENTELSIAKSNVTIAITDGDGRFNNTTDYRIYKNAEFTVSCSNGNITKIEFTCNSGNPLSGFEDATGLDKTNNVWTGNAESVSFTASNKQVQITQLIVTYKEDTRTNPGISWDPASAELTLADGLTQADYPSPNLVILEDLGLNPLENITLSSDNVNLATISKTNGQININWTLNVSGTVQFTATFDGDATYKPATAVCTVTINPATPVVLTDYYEKVTSGTVAEGTYLIVYEEGSLAFNGGLETLDAVSNSIAVEITSDNKIGVSSATEAATVYIDPTEGTIKAANGKYIGVSSWNNGLQQSATYIHNVLEIDGDGNAQIGIYNAEWNTTGGTMRLQYNKTSGQTRFRYFKNGGQQSVALYKLANEVIKPASGLAWSPAGNIELTVGGDFTAPTLQNPNTIDGSEITIESSNTSLATIEDGVAKLVADATGTAVISATYTGTTYKPVTVSYTIKVNPASSITVAPSLYANFGSVDQGATLPDAKTITVTLNNVAAATATLGGTNPEAFSATPTALTESGDITISVVSSETVGSFSATLTISDDADAAASKTVNLSFTVKAPEAAEEAVSTTSKWVAATTVEDGMTVLITGVKSDVVYAMSASSSNGNNRTSVAGSLDEGVFTPGENTMPFTLVATGAADTYYIKTSNDKYLYNGSTSGNSYLKTKAEAEDVSWTITLDNDGNAVITSVENTNRQLMRFNLNGSSNPLFNCYASNQQPVKLYVPQQVTPPTPTYEKVREGLLAERYYTFCYNKTMTAVQGATFWSFASREGDAAYLVKEDAPYAAGKPYIIYAESAGDLTAVLEDEETNVAGSNGVLYGTLAGMDQDALTEAANTLGSPIYLLSNNKLFRVTGDGTSGNGLGANRAYIAYELLPNGKPNAAPDRVRRVQVQDNAATGIDELNASETPMKVMINGQLFIIRGEKMYDATGRLVK